MIEFGPFRYDAESRFLYRGDEEIMLPPRVLAVLESLLKRPGKVVTKGAVLESAWGGAFVGEDSLTQAVSQLRRALGDDPQRPTYIQTIPKRGYRFITEVSEPLRSQGPIPEPTDFHGEEPVRASQSPPSPSPELTTLVAGTKVGNYELLAQIGAGAMGEVWRARDTELQRDVAIKVVPKDLAAEAAVIERFRREALMLAAVNHPNIVTIHGVEEVGGVRFIVMELLDGGTLRERLEQNALTVDEALNVAIQVAQALEVAHDAGIVHRDLKPANIIVNPKGHVKVLDFGLARDANLGDGSASVDSTPLTTSGLLIGTAAYMSPEQAAGKPIDKRSDIFSFGCVLFEMLAGQRPFGGDTASELVAAILRDAPDYSLLPDTTPTDVRTLLRRCLRKDPDRRLRDIGDAWVEIETTLTGPTPVVLGDGASVSRTPLWRRALPWAAAGILTGALATVVVWSLMNPTAQVEYSDLVLPPGTYLWGGHPDEARMGGNRPGSTAFVLTPDGRSVVFAATDGQSSRLYFRRPGDRQAIPIEGTEGGVRPVMSPDGEEVGFFSRADREIRVVPIGGGTPSIVAADVDVKWMSWTEDWIAYASDASGIFAPDASSIFRVSRLGGEPEQVTAVDQETEYGHAHPHVLPGGNAFLYTVLKVRHEWRYADIVVQRIGEEPAVLIEGAADARYLPTGHVIFLREGVLWGAGFDPESLKLTGPEVRLMGDVMQSVGGMNTSIDSGTAQISVSESGSLLFARGGPYPAVRRPLVWVRPDGNDVPEVEPLDIVPAGTTISWHVRISRDGARVAYDGPEAVYNRQIVVLDLETGGVEQTDLPGHQEQPVWSPDGGRVAFLSEHKDIYWLPADNLKNADPQPVTTDGVAEALFDWSLTDVLLYAKGGEDAGLYTIDFSGDGQPARFADSGEWATFSPEGDWIAYSRYENDQPEIYVRPYPTGRPEYSVTRGSGGASPAWSRDSTTLFYRAGRNFSEKMMAVDVDLGGSSPIVRGTHRELFNRYMGGTSEVRSYDVFDGRFLMFERSEQPDQRVTTLVLILNWFEQLKELMPTGR